MQRLATQHSSVLLGRLLGAEQQDAWEGCDWLEGDVPAGLSGAEVGPIATVDHTHLNIVDLGILKNCKKNIYMYI